MQHCIARQPVLDVAKSVFGYELLFRNGFENCYKFVDGDKATLDVLATTLFHTPFPEMVSGRRGLVNFTRNLLLSDVALLFPKDHIIIEVLEDVKPDDAVIAACRRLKSSGYTIAMDDFVAADLCNPLLNLADIVKVDFLQTRGDDRKIIAEKLRARKITLLAEKVEDEEDYRQGRLHGYRYFQGYFFSKPVIKPIQRLPSNKLACLRMLQTIAKDDFDFIELNNIVNSDVTLTYRVLSLVNSAFFSFRMELTSTLHALMLLGRDHIRRFVSIISVSTLGDGKPSELVLSCMARARLCEKIASRIGLEMRSGEFFLTGLFSLIDTMMDRPMAEVLANLPISQDVSSALLGEQNTLRRTLDAVVAYERGRWDEFTRATASLGLQEDVLPEIYSSTIRWATDLFNAI